MNKKSYYTYGIREKYTNVELYVGMTGSVNPNYYGSGRLWGKVLIEISRRNLTKEILFIGNDKHEVHAKEIAYVALFNTTLKGGGFNVSETGGTGPSGTHSEFSKQKMSKAQKGVPKSEETKQKMSKARKGVPISEETKQKIRDAHLGKHHLPETKQKISKALKGVPISEETKQKMRKPHKEFSEETKQKMSAAARAAHRIPGKIYDEDKLAKKNEAKRRRRIAKRDAKYASMQNLKMNNNMNEQHDETN